MGPETALLVSAIAATAAAGVSTLQAVGQASATADAEKANAEIQRQNAALAREKAVQREVAVRREARQVLARQRAGIAESGQGFSGTTALGYEMSAQTAELDALLMRYQGDLEARGLAFDADLAMRRSRQARGTIPGTLIAGGLGMGASALSGYGAYQQNRTLPASGGMSYASGGTNRVGSTAASGSFGGWP